MMVFDGKVYILDGAHYLCFDGETVQEVKSLALTPTTYIGRDPLGGGTQYQQRKPIAGCVYQHVFVRREEPGLLPIHDGH